MLASSSGAEVGQRPDGRGDREAGQGAWAPFELQAKAGDMVVLGHAPVRLRGVDVGVDEGVGEARRGDPRQLREEREEESVAGDVVRDAKRDVAAPLREVQVEPGATGVVELHVEDEEAVARRQLARLRVAGRPGRDHEAPAHGVGLELREHPGDLIAERCDRGASRPSRRPVDREVTPEVAVGGGDAPRLVRPRVPELALVLLEEADARVAAEEPRGSPTTMFFQEISFVVRSGKPSRRSIS